MRDYLTIGSTPYGEPCAQVGSSDYSKLSRIESQVFASQCKRVLQAAFDDPHTEWKEIKVDFSSHSFLHDFGSYREVVVYFDTDDKESAEQAYYLEAANIEHWDEQALAELASHNYTLHKKQLEWD